MKKLMVIALVVAAFSANAQEVYSEKVTGIDKNYKSFGFLSQDKAAQPNTADALILNSPYSKSIMVFTDPKYPQPEVREEIEDAIKQKMIDHGYAFKESDPDLIVSFYVFKKDGKLTGDFVGDSRRSVVPNAKEDVKIDKGTLLVAVSGKDGKMLWEGFNKDTFKNGGNINESDVMKGVVSIMDRFALDNNNEF